MTEIYITRHGETDWNAQQIFRGRADVELNATGIKQAELLSAYLKDVKFEAIYSSPMERALRTAQLVAKTHYRVKVAPSMDLVDMDFGEWQGVSVEDVREKYKDVYSRWLKEPHRVKIPGGESFGDVKKRVQKFISSITANHEGKVLVITHRIVAKIMVLEMLGLDISRFANIKMDTCGVSVFDYDKEKYVLAGHNDTSFLKSLQKASPGDF